MEFEITTIDCYAYSLQCNGCDAVGPMATTKEEAIEFAEIDSWILKSNGSRALCPDCIERREPL